PGEEGAGPVHGIEHPLTARAAFADSELLAVHAVLRHFGGEQLAHRLLGLAVGDGDRRRIALALGRNGLTEMRPDRRPRGVGKAMGKGDFGGEVHTPPSGKVRRMKASNIGTVNAVSPWFGL